MKKESLFLLPLSLVTTLGLCLSANLAYLTWFKSDTAANYERAQEDIKKIQNSARQSYAS